MIKEITESEIIIIFLRVLKHEYKIEDNNRNQN